MEKVISTELERFSEKLLSQDERQVLKGVEFNKLPQTFEVSPTVYKACLEVWEAFEKYEPIKESQAWDRATKYYKKKADKGDEEAIKFLNRRSSYWDKVEKTIEFGRQIYRQEKDIVVGRVHTGSHRNINTRNNLDGIADEEAIVNIHSHPSNLTFSEGDVIYAVADLKEVPLSCLYYVVGSKNLNLLCPTIETPRIKLEVLRKELGRTFDEEYRFAVAPEAEKEKLAVERIRRLADRFKLGYYVSERDIRLDRIK